MFEALTRGSCDEVILEDPDRTRTRGELFERVTRIAGVLRHGFGLGPGDHAAILVGNRVEFVELTLAAMFSGIWLTPVNWHLGAEQIRYICADSDARVVIVDPTVVPTIDPMTDPTSDPVGFGVRTVRIGDEFDALVDRAVPLVPEPGDPAGATMPYTSGTTGRPKGVRRFVHPRLEDQLQALVAGGHVIGLDGVGTHLVTGPMYHAAPGGFALRDLLAGARLVIMQRWDEADALRAIECHRVTHTHLVPTMFARLLRLPQDLRRDFDASSLVTVLHGAAPMPVELKHRMIDWWGPVLVEYWGASEGGVVTLVDSLRWLERPGTVGRAIPGREVFAVDRDGRRLGAGEVGVLWVDDSTTDQVFEYHRDPARTAEAFGGPSTYTLGDTGSVDAQGFVTLTGRVTDMIISGGVNIYPVHVEDVLRRHDAVDDVAVFGIPDDEWGESVLAAVQLADGYAPSDETATSILDFARAHLAGFEVPRLIDFRDRLPRAVSGKLLKEILREPYWAGLDRSI